MWRQLLLTGDYESRCFAAAVLSAMEPVHFRRVRVTYEDAT